MFPVHPSGLPGILLRLMCPVSFRLYNVPDIIFHPGRGFQACLILRAGIVYTVFPEGRENNGHRKADPSPEKAVEAPPCCQHQPDHGVCLPGHYPGGHAAAEPAGGFPFRAFRRDHDIPVHRHIRHLRNRPCAARYLDPVEPLWPAGDPADDPDRRPRLYVRGFPRLHDAPPEDRHAGADGHGGSHRIQQHEQHRRPPAPPAGPCIRGGGHRCRRPDRALFGGLSVRPGAETGRFPFDIRLLQCRL